MIPFCKENIYGDVGLIPWSPISRGKLAKPVGSEKSVREKTDVRFKQSYLKSLDEADDAIIGRVEEISKKHGVSMAAVATAWTIAKGCAPIVGLSSTKRVDDILTALTVKLTEEDIKYLEEPYRPKALEL